VRYSGDWSEVWSPKYVVYDKAGNIGEDSTFGRPAFSWGRSIFEDIVLPNNYTGYIGRFFIIANFVFGDD
jgi:hypothetical protein